MNNLPLETVMATRQFDTLEALFQGCDVSLNGRIFEVVEVGTGNTCCHISAKGRIGRYYQVVFNRRAEHARDYVVDVLTISQRSSCVPIHTRP